MWKTSLYPDKNYSLDFLKAQNIALFIADIFSIFINLVLNITW